MLFLMPFLLPGNNLVPITKHPKNRRIILFHQFSIKTDIQPYANHIQTHSVNGVPSWCVQALRLSFVLLIIAITTASR